MVPVSRGVTSCATVIMGAPQGKDSTEKDIGTRLCLFYFKKMIVRFVNADYSYFGGAESFQEGRSPRRTVVVSPSVKDDGKTHFGPPQNPSDFLWLMTEEPHRSRRMAIMKAHPEVSLL